ncbi:MAG: hypothetical protein P4M11_08205, partial [Candidatus Pacebacteria bacterium]|nr:hypothetical protein [Candidatus Paceibacterota bacterium]
QNPKTPKPQNPKTPGPSVCARGKMWERDKNNNIARWERSFTFNMAICPISSWRTTGTSRTN